MRHMFFFLVFLKLCRGSVTRGVFSSGLANVTCYRIPVVVSTKAGTLLAMAEARHGSCDDSAAQEIAVRRSTDGGVSWGPVGFLAGPSVQNPAAAVLESGRVVVAFAAKDDNNEPIKNGVAYSDDDGRSWGQRFVDWGVANGSQPGPGAAAVVGERLVVAAHHGAYQVDYSAYSDDSGETWTVSNSTLARMDEAAVAPISGGLMLNMRHHDSATLGRAVSRSFDEGETWSGISYDAALLAPACEASLVRVAGALYFSAPASTTSRQNLTIRRSNDDGVSWLPTTVLVDAGPSYGYSCLVGLNDTVGGILYEATGKTSIDFASFYLDVFLGRTSSSSSTRLRMAAVHE